MKKAILILCLIFAQSTFAQYGQGGKLYSNDGKFLGNVNNNQYDPNSISNPYGRYGSEFSSDSINNPYSRYGNQYSNQYVPNPIRKPSKNAWGN